jgi:hypothetical protein
MSKLSFIFFTALLAGCSSGPEKKGDAEDRINDREERLKAFNVGKASAAKLTLESAPEWYLKPLLKDERGIYSASVGISYNLTTALKKAKLILQFQLSSRLKSGLSSKERITEGYDSDYNMIINDFIKKVNVSNIEEISQEIDVVKGKYHVYILGLYPYSSIKSEILKLNSNHIYGAKMKAYNSFMKRVSKEEAEKNTVQQ